MKDNYTKEKLRLAKIEQAYTDFYRILFSELMKHYTSDPSVAEDILQSTFERVLKYGHNFDTYDKKSAFRFLYTIMRHEAYDTIARINKETLHVNVDEILDSITNHSLESALNPEFLYLEKTVVREAVQQLPDDYASVICLYYFYGFQHNEIAKLLNITENNAAQKCFYIRKKLKEILTKEGFHDER
jgi:RNA polymerase sigma-70 factor (ECF subfamily)